LYNLIIVNSDYSEIIDGSAGGYFTTEDIADKYLSLNSFLIWLFIIINIILFLSQFWLKPNLNLSSGDETNKRNYLILLLFISIITCFVSLMFLIILLNYSVSYGG
jgi:membrane protein insertase Oxa1/YidC/SpoIIIJ